MERADAHHMDDVRAKEKNNVDFLIKNDLNYSYDKSISNHLFDIGETSDKILKHFYEGVE